MNYYCTNPIIASNRRRSPRLAMATAMAAASASRSGLVADGLLISSDNKKIITRTILNPRFTIRRTQQRVTRGVPSSCSSVPHNGKSERSNEHRNSTEKWPKDENCEQHISASKSSSTGQAALTAKPSDSRSVAKKKSSKIVSVSDAARTKSFEPLWYGSGTLMSKCTDGDQCPPIHTLILGTHPSITSLSKTQYFGHDQNAFWWIVGDCLQFRRSEGLSTATKRPFALCQYLRYNNVLPYDEQVLRLCSHGFALWDVVASCSRAGSLDSNIRKEIPNDIKGFCQSHPSIRRIVFANGFTGCAMFYKHNKPWWEEDLAVDVNEPTLNTESINKIILFPGSNVESQRAFSRFLYRRDKYCSIEYPQQHQFIECISALSVSPAAAAYSYEAKRDHWEKYCFQPGLEDFHNWQQGKVKLV